MNTIRKIKRSTKALSPVVASIILIAVTVAVSIAVAAWMGALVVNQMATEELKITSMTCDTTAETITVKASNTGTSAVTINEVWVNGEAIDSDNVTGVGTPISENTVASFVITLDDVQPGFNYQVKLVSAAGNSFTYTASAPS